MDPLLLVLLLLSATLTACTAGDRSGAGHNDADVADAPADRDARVTTVADADDSALDVAADADADPSGLCAAVVCEALDNCHDIGECDSDLGTCSHPEKPNGTACDDGDLCTQTGWCSAGDCLGEEPIDCSANVCREAGTCDPTTGQCSGATQLDGTPCSDDDACTRTDSCQAGACVGANPVECTAEDDCHYPGACNPLIGTCPIEAYPDGTACAGGICLSAACTVVWAHVAAGTSHSCAITTDGKLYCWGSMGNGRLGENCVTNECARPHRVGIRTDWATVALGDAHSCGITSGGTLWCWGANTVGQLGAGGLPDQWSPVQVGSWTDWEALSLGGWHTCGIRTNGTLWCWGLNEDGQLGIGGTATQTSPQQVGTATNWAAVAAGASHTCARLDGGTLWCWGANGSGQLGIGPSALRFAPERVGTESAWASIAADSARSCATKADGTLWCWGANSSGELGDGTTSPRDVPVRVGTDTTWANLDDIGIMHTCTPRTDGTLWCWGANVASQLGDGTGGYRSNPAQLGVLTDWVGVAAGGCHTCALRELGSLWCWGCSTNGQTGTGLFGYVATPTGVAVP